MRPFYGARAAGRRSPVADLPPIAVGGSPAVEPGAVFPLEFHGPPAERDLWERVIRPDIGESVLRVVVRVADARVVVVRGVGRPGVRWHLGRAAIVQAGDRRGAERRRVGT